MRGNSPNVNRLVLVGVGGGLIGWWLFERATFQPIALKLGFESMVPGIVAWLLLSAAFGVAFGYCYPRRWYLAPVVALWIDLLLFASYIVSGHSNLWPVGIALRLMWVFVMWPGAFLARYVRLRFRAVPLP